MVETLISITQMPYFHINDVFVTGMLPEACGFERKSLFGVWGELLALRKIDPDRDVALHYSDSKRKAIIYHIFHKQSHDFNKNNASYSFHFDGKDFLRCESSGKCVVIPDIADKVKG